MNISSITFLIVDCRCVIDSSHPGNLIMGSYNPCRVRKGNFFSGLLFVFWLHFFQSSQKYLKNKQRKTDHAASVLDHRPDSLAFGKSQSLFHVQQLIVPGHTNTSLTCQLLINNIYCHFTSCWNSSYSHVVVIIFGSHFCICICFDCHLDSCIIISRGDVFAIRSLLYPVCACVCVGSSFLLGDCWFMVTKRWLSPGRKKNTERNIYDVFWLRLLEKNLVNLMFFNESLR